VTILVHVGPDVGPSYIEPVARWLAENGRNVVWYQQRGVGVSHKTNGSYEMADYVSDLEAVRAYFGADKVHLWGHSFGGVPIVDYARLHPEHVSSLFFSCAVPGLGPTEFADVQNAIANWGLGKALAQGNESAQEFLGWYADSLSADQRIARPALKKVMKKTWTFYFPLPDQAKRAPSDFAGAIRTNVPQQVGLSSVGRLNAADFTGLNQELVTRNIPAHILFAEHDMYGTTTHYLSDRLPSAGLTVLAGAGHIPYVQAGHDAGYQADSYFEVLRQFYGL
jgi:proline iminopeptidase